MPIGPTPGLTAGVPRAVPAEVSRCLFRVLQEALNNTFKHSGTGRAVVTLTGGPGVIELKVRDFGSGITPDLMETTRGLGLITMRERVAMLKGTFSIESPPDGGTEIEVSITLDPDRPRDD